LPPWASIILLAINNNPNPVPSKGFEANLNNFDNVSERMHSSVSFTLTTTCPWLSFFSAIIVIVPSPPSLSLANYSIT
jgi:hypothetical protein